MTVDEAEITFTCEHCREDTVTTVSWVFWSEGVYADCPKCDCEMKPSHVNPGSDECGATSEVFYKCPECHAEWHETALEMTHRLGGPWCSCCDESCHVDMPLGNRGVAYE